MYCPSCGCEADAQGQCPVCAQTDPVAAGDAFASSRPEAPRPAWMVPVLGVVSVILWMLILAMNYVQAMTWAGVMKAELVGYLIGGCLSALAISALLVFVVQKMRRKKFLPSTKVFAISLTAFVLSLLSLAGSYANPHGRFGPDTNGQVGTLLKEAAGKQASATDAHWWDSPTRGMFHDLLERNQHYIADVRALDSSAIKNLYATDSYAGPAHMQKVIAQLQAMRDLEQKYASIDPIFAKLQERIASAGASQQEKDDFMKGVRSTLQTSQAPREKLMRCEEHWIGSTIELYEFTLAHSNDYSIRDRKLYFANNQLKNEFISRQSKAIELHKEFLKTKKEFEENRTSKLNQLGVSPSDFTPEQMGKLK
jgi:hypothetical protein